MSKENQKPAPGAKNKTVVVKKSTVKKETGKIKPVKKTADKKKTHCKKMVEVKPVIPEITKEETYSVKFIFSEDEINNFARRAADESKGIEVLASEAKAQADFFKSKIRQKQGELSELMGHIHSGFKYENVKCVVKMNDPQMGLKTYYYNGEMVKDSTQKMLASDFQTKIDFENQHLPNAEKELSLHILVIVDSTIVSNEIISDTPGLKQFLKKCVENNNPVIRNVDTLLDDIKRDGITSDFSNTANGMSLRNHLEQKALLTSFLNLFN